MKPTQQLHDLGQSLWLGSITRGLLTNGTLRRYIDELSIIVLTSISVNGLKLLPLTIVVGLALPAAFAASEPMDVQTIIQRSVEANERNWEAALLYNFAERDRSPGGTRTYEVMMIEGSPYERLLSMNNVLLRPDQQAEELRKLDAVTAERRAESQQQRVERISKYERERKRDHLLLDQLTTAFDFTLMGQRKLGDFEVYELKATPRAGYQPPVMDADVLTGMEGRLWIDTRTFQWVKVTARVIHAVSIGGFLARVEPGTQFELEKMPVQDDIWLPKHFSMKSRAKILFLFSHQTAKDETYFDHRLAPQAPNEVIYPGLRSFGGVPPSAGADR